MLSELLACGLDAPTTIHYAEANGSMLLDEAEILQKLGLVHDSGCFFLIVLTYFDRLL